MTEVRSGTLKAFDNVGWLATVQLSGSLSQWLRGIPVSRSIAAAEMIAGRKIALALFDPTNAADGVVVAVYV